MTHSITPYVVVNDASCLIDLRKGRLLHVILKLPYRFIVPLPIRDSELLDFTDQEWQILDDGGMNTFDLPPDQIAEAFGIKANYPKLSANDCFCLVTTRYHSKSILLTGDTLLRKVAEESSLKVHGVLWIIDKLKAEKICTDELLISALKLWQDDPLVFLPNTEIERRIRALS